MSTKLKHQGNDKPADNVTQITTKCCAQDCKKASKMMSFCEEHYDWFKFGLVTKEGKHPSDFDKKFQAYQKHHKKAA